MKNLKKIVALTMIIMISALILVNSTKATVNDMHLGLMTNNAHIQAGENATIGIWATTDILEDNDGLLLEFDKTKLQFVSAEAGNIDGVTIEVGNRENHPAGADGVAIAMCSNLAGKAKIPGGSDIATITFKVLKEAKGTQNIKLVHYKGSTRTEIVSIEIYVHDYATETIGGNNNGNIINSDGWNNPNSESNKENNTTSGDNNNNKDEHQNYINSDGGDIPNNESNKENNTTNGDNNNNKDEDQNYINTTGRPIQDNESNDVNNTVNNDDNKDDNNQNSENVSYEMLEGENLTWNYDRSKNLVFRSNADFADFLNVSIDGNVINKENYIAKEGSTIIELKEVYLKTIKSGTHEISINSKKGSAIATFKVIQAEENSPTILPQTGEELDLLMVIVGTLLLINVGIATILYYKNK